MPGIAQRVATGGTNIFSEINDLALHHDAINLGQGRPDFAPLPRILAPVIDALQAGQQYNQYPSGLGSPNLRRAIAQHAARFYNLELDALNGIVVTAGATEGVFVALMALVNPGDEVIVIEPFFDSYVPNIQWAGGVPVYVPLHPPHWTLDPGQLRAAFTPRTRALIWNAPHNPTGRVFSRAELDEVAALCIAHDVAVIADEVYEHLTFGAPHIPIATLPGMLERTVTVSSAGKTFSITGWKVGWVSGPPALMTGVWRIHQYTTFAVNAPAQEGVAAALALPGDYFEEFQAMYAARRDLLMQGIAAGGLRAAAPQGTYFVMADFSQVFDGDDMAFARYLATEIGVACIPPGPFYSDPHKAMASKHARFAFCKGEDTLQRAAERLARLRR